MAAPFSLAKFEQGVRSYHSKLLKRLGVKKAPPLKICVLPHEAGVAYLDHADLIEALDPVKADTIRKNLGVVQNFPPDRSPLYNSLYIPGKTADYIVVSRNVAFGKPPNYLAAKHEAAHAAVQAKLDEILGGFSFSALPQSELIAHLHFFLVEREASARRNVRRYLKRNYPNGEAEPGRQFPYEMTLAILRSRRLNGRKIRQLLVRLGTHAYASEAQVKAEVSHAINF